MRPLEEEEIKLVFAKLHKYVGGNMRAMVERADEPHVFRLHNKRVYYLREALLRRAQGVSRKSLVYMGTCVGKFTHAGKFHLVISALDVLAKYAKHKIWLKPSSEMSFLYGNHVQKSGLGRITEDTPQYSGVVIYSMADVPLGFGVAAKSTQECRKLDPGTVVAFHQGDVGEYLRNEDEVAGQLGHKKE